VEPHLEELVEDFVVQLEDKTQVEHSGCLEVIALVG